MTVYHVNATKTVFCWAEVEADTPEQALDAAADLPADAFDSDDSTATVDFNVTPAVEVVS